MANNKKVALITGANRGLGFETARQLGEKGVTVLLAARDLGKAQEAAGKLKAEGIDAEGIQLDVTNAEDRASAVKEIGDRFGKLDILINNAGLFRGPLQGNTTSTASEQDIRDVFETNLFSVINVTRAFLPLLKKSDEGRVVNLSSILGSLTIHSDPKGPLAGSKNFGYDASKTALNAFTVHLADELKDTPIKVNSVHPGWVKTEMGSDAAPMEIPEGVKTSVAAALLGSDGPNGQFIHMGEQLPW